MKDTIESTQKKIRDSLSKAVQAAEVAEWELVEDLAIDVMSLLVHLETLRKGKQHCDITLSL